MPADRKRNSRKAKKEGAAASTPGIQLTWTMPVEAENVTGIEFASSLTPTSFRDNKKKFVPVSSPDAAGDVKPSAPAEPTLFPHATPELDAPRKPTHQKKKAENHIPRPPNAFILFRSSFIKSNHVSNDVETDHSQLSKIIGMTWQSMPEDERKFWHSKALDAQAEHKKKYPNYAFRPAASRSAAPSKRRVRADVQRDGDRCARIAELLVEGKKGAEIAVAIKEFDKQNAKPVIARFEEPVTARQFRRRSCSQPPPEMQPLFTTMQFVTEEPTQPAQRRVRAASSQPSSRRTRSRTAASTPAPASGPSTPAATSPAASSPYISSSPLVDVPEDSEMPPLVARPPEFDMDFTQFAFESAHPYEFNAYSFNAGSASSPYPESCDPLTPSMSTSMGDGVYAEHAPDASYAPLSTGPSEHMSGGSYPPLSIDTSFFGSWNVPPSSSPFSSSPGGFAATDQPPPFSALTPVAAPEYTHADYLPIAPTDGSNHAFDPSYGHSSYVPAPPYGDFTNIGAPTPETAGDYMLQKGDYPYYAHKVAGDTQHPYPIQNMQSYPPQELFNYSL